MKRFVSIALIALLAACGGGTADVTVPPMNTGTPPDGSDPPPGSDVPANPISCDSISGGGAQVSSAIAAGCLTCSLDNAAAAADGDPASYASVAANSPLPAQGVSIRATAQDGVVYPAGEEATVFLIEEDSVLGTSISLANVGVQLRTYLGGVQQESGTSLGPFSCGNCGPGGIAYGGVSLQTTKQFDAVEIFLDPGLVTDALLAPNYRVYEICSNGGH